MLRINELSDDCLRLIFSRLSLSCKLTLHRICPRWRSLQYSVTSTHKSVTLLLGTGTYSRTLLKYSHLKVQYLDQIEPHSNSGSFNERSTLELSNLSPNVVSQLKQLLPNVTSLEVCLNQCSEQNYVLDLLLFWSSKLKILSLCYNNTKRNGYRDLNGVQSHFELINAHCLALDTLSIELLGNVYIVQWPDYRRGRFIEKITLKPHLDLRCLGWLSEFRFYSQDPVDVLFDSLKSYANEGLKKIAIGNDRGRRVDFVQRLPQIVPKFTLLSSIRAPSEYSKFTGLTTLSMDMASLSLTQFTTHLAPLKSLVHVKLCVCTTVQNDLSQYNSTPSHDLAQLPSIRIIQIEIRAKTYRKLQSRHWGWILQSLELLELRTLDKSAYPIPTRVDTSVRSARLDLLLESFKWQCTKLKRIVSLDKYSIVNGIYTDERKVLELVGPNNWNEVVSK